MDTIQERGFQSLGHALLCGTSTATRPIATGHKQQLHASIHPSIVLSIPFHTSIPRSPPLFRLSAAHVCISQMLSLALPVTRNRPLPRALTQPTGIAFLPPNLRVSTEELNRQDAQWRALREAAYARAWAEDATLVGSIVSYGNGEAGGERRGSVSRSRRRKKRKALKALLKWIEMGGSSTNSSSSSSSPSSGEAQPQTVTSAGAVREAAQTQMHLQSQAQAHAL